MIDGTSVYGLSGCASTHWRQPSNPRSPGVEAGPLGGSVIGLTVAPAATKCANCARIASLVPVVPNGSLNADAGTPITLPASAPACSAGVQSAGRCPLATSSSGSPGASIVVALSSSA